MPHDTIDDFNDDLEFAIDEAELEIMRGEPRTHSLLAWIRPSTARRLAQYCREQHVSDNVVIEVVLAAFLYEQGY